MGAWLKGWGGRVCLAIPVGFRMLRMRGKPDGWWEVAPRYGLELQCCGRAGHPSGCPWYLLKFLLQTSLSSQLAWFGADHPSGHPCGLLHQHPLAGCCWGCSSCIFPCSHGMVVNSTCAASRGGQRAPRGGHRLSLANKHLEKREREPMHVPGSFSVLLPGGYPMLTL